MFKTRIWKPCWKLTRPDHTTHGSCQWGRGVTNPHGVKSGEGALSSSGFYHAYDSPYLAVMLNPIHGNIAEPVLWQAEWRGSRRDDNGLKFGVTELRTIRVVPAPVVTTNQKIAFAIFCTAQCFDEATCPAWYEWATNWLTGEDRSANSAALAARSAAESAALAAKYTRGSWRSRLAKSSGIMLRGLRPPQPQLPASPPDALEIRAQSPTKEKS